MAAILNHFHLLTPQYSLPSLRHLVTCTANNSNPLCLTKIVGINAVLFAAFGLHVALMPFKNPIHNHLEAGSLVLNFALFDTALLASRHGDASHMLALGWVLDIIRIVSVIVLVGYGVYENRAGLPRCCTSALRPWQRHQVIAHAGIEDALLTDEERDDDGKDDDVAAERQPGFEDELVGPIAAEAEDDGAW
jgi:hypothetical protein